MVDRAAWLAERRLGIGGSDVKDLLEVADEGCRRRLAYDKRGTPADYPEEETTLMRRGRVLEAAAAEEYAVVTGRRLLKRKAMVHPQHKWARVNIDRTIAADTRGRGVLEIKTHGAFIFAQVKRDGAKQSHVLQLQHALLVTRRTWGAFAILHPDSWQLLHFELEADPRLQAAIVDEGTAFWEGLERGAELPPANYAPGHKLCRGCPWRQTCHGAEAVMYGGLMPEERAEQLERLDVFNEIVADYVAAQKAAAAATDVLELVKGALKAELEGAGVDAFECGAGRVYYRAQARHDIDVKRLRRDKPELAAEYTRDSMVRALRVFARGEG